MKKITYFLMGAGAVVAGFFAYALLSDSPRPSKETTQSPQDPQADPTPPRYSSQDYVAHRREFFQKRAAERAAAGSTEETGVPHPAPQPADPAQGPSADEAANQVEDAHESIPPTQEEHPAPEAPEPASASEDFAEAEDGKTVECHSEPVPPSAGQDAEMQDTEQEQAEEPEPEKQGEDQTK